MHHGRNSIHRTAGYVTRMSGGVGGGAERFLPIPNGYPNPPPLIFNFLLGCPGPLALFLIGLYGGAFFKFFWGKVGVFGWGGGSNQKQFCPFFFCLGPPYRNYLFPLCLKKKWPIPRHQSTPKKRRRFFSFPKAGGKEKISKVPRLRDPIESLAPGARMQFLLGVGGTIFAPGVDEALCPKVFSIKAWYQYAGHIYEEVNTIDLRPMLHSAAIQDPIAEEVKRLRESLEKLLKK